LPGSGYSIIFNIPSPAATFTLALHDIRGRLISVIASGNKNPGKHIFKWDGLTAHGDLATGAYVLKFECDGIRSSSVFFLLR
jgi:flagellar hook assembly protein FlgD